jgi:hypothetical protein
MKWLKARVGRGNSKESWGLLGRSVAKSPRRRRRGVVLAQVSMMGRHPKRARVPALALDLIWALGALIAIISAAWRDGNLQGCDNLGI